MHDREGMVTRWLRSKSIHPADIAATLEWVKLEESVGRRPTDAKILEHAEALHAQAVNKFREIAPGKIEVIHSWTWSWKVGGAALVGALIGELIGRLF